ncbi:CoA transferase [Pseudonocardia kunmingensis]|uniref:CoA transferase family III n=1 Tax=Pseudonocardia kunmingensis TaxID=630975 RepID=A0A543DQ56_9PSEU|nr:CoA transferase family III [Pseudonocardia kunmingensis]
MLSGVSVVSFTHFLQGPSATQILADLGADVVKVEPTGGAFGQHTRDILAGLDLTPEQIDTLVERGVVRG